MKANTRDLLVLLAVQGNPELGDAVRDPESFVSRQLSDELRDRALQESPGSSTGVGAFVRGALWQRIITAEPQLADRATVVGADRMFTL